MRLETLAAVSRRNEGSVVYKICQVQLDTGNVVFPSLLIPGVLSTTCQIWAKLPSSFAVGPAIATENWIGGQIRLALEDDRWIDDRWILWEDGKSWILLCLEPEKNYRVIMLSFISEVSFTTSSAQARKYEHQLHLHRLYRELKWALRSLKPLNYFSPVTFYAGHNICLFLCWSKTGKLSFIDYLISLVVGLHSFNQCWSICLTHFMYFWSIYAILGQKEYLRSHLHCFKKNFVRSLLLYTWPYLLRNQCGK